MTRQPAFIRLLGWIEKYDLRRLRRDAVLLARAHRLNPGDALLVSGSRYRGARRFAFLVQTQTGPMVMVPQTSDKDLLLSLTLRVAEAARQAWGEEKSDA